MKHSFPLRSRYSKLENNSCFFLESEFGCGKYDMKVQKYTHVFLREISTTILKSRISYFVSLMLRLRELIVYIMF